MSMSVKIKSADGDVFNWDMDIITKYSPVVKKLVKSGKISDDEEVIHLSKISTVAMEKILSWCNFHTNLDPESENLYQQKSHWDQEFLNVDVNTLFDILISAHHLDIKLLVELCCDKVVNQIKGKQPEELRTLFQISNDLKPEEEDIIRLENEWMGI